MELKIVELIVGLSSITLILWMYVRMSRDMEKRHAELREQLRLRHEAEKRAFETAKRAALDAIEDMKRKGA